MTQSPEFTPFISHIHTINIIYKVKYTRKFFPLKTGSVWAIWLGAGMSRVQTRFFHHIITKMCIYVLTSQFTLPASCSMTNEHGNMQSLVVMIWLGFVAEGWQFSASKSVLHYWWRVSYGFAQGQFQSPGVWTISMEYAHACAYVCAHHWPSPSSRR